MVRKSIGIVSIFLYLGLIIYNVQGSGDLPAYINWAKTALSGDINQIESVVLSPRGVPLTQWSHGIGYLMAFPLWLVSTISVGKVSFGPSGWEWGAFGCGIAAAILCFWALYKTVRGVVPEGTPGILWILAFPIAFLGTHLGYYSRVCSLEIFACSLLALLNAYALLSAPRLRNTLLVGILGSLLIIIRPYLGVFALLAAGVHLYGYWSREPRTGLRVLARPGLIIAVTWALALLQIAFINRWMTGSAFHFPYNFGNQDFQSMDLRHAQFLSVLFHPWHGLFLYHPFYGIGLAAAVRLLVSRESSRELRLLLCGVICSIAVLIVIHSSWYCWWMGVSTFGMRGMAITAVVLVPIFILLLSRLRGRKGESRIWWLAAQACLLWSGLLLWTGQSNYYTLREILGAQIQNIQSLIGIFTIPAIILGSAAAGLVSKFRRRSAAADNDPPVALWQKSAACWISFATVILLKPILSSLVDSGRQATAILLTSGIAFLVTLFARFAIEGYHADSHQPPFPAEGQGRGLLEWGMIAVFVVCCGLFARLAVHTETKIASGQVDVRGYTYQSPFQIDEFESSYREYTMVSGFDGEKARMKKFLDFAVAHYRIKQQ